VTRRPLDVRFNFNFRSSTEMLCPVSIAVELATDRRIADREILLVLWRFSDWDTGRCTLEVPTNCSKTRAPGEAIDTSNTHLLSDG